MPADRLTVRGAPTGATAADISLLTVDPSRFPAVWEAYRHGLDEVCSGIGAGGAIPGPEAPAGVTTVVVAATPDQEVVGGVLLRDRTDVPRRTGLPHLAAAVAERLPEGVSEVGGCWVLPACRGRGLGVALVREAVQVVAGRGRWTVALANRSGLGTAVRAGFVPDDRFRDLPLPDARSPRTLCWFDHCAEDR
ncbi:GNAT family N-acetyltransferase [Actinosynnema sp. NPDC023658]|uniref:GNAT family N-acetyltransferase n=1 Tax=Actinosynnema sp. NPDC023658 TaxID=3155465 RepID=UPI0033D73AA0